MIGFSGGGAVAILVSAQRRDVTGIRTVAGNLNHKVWTTYHNVNPLKGSLNAVDVANKVSDIPQIHYVGDLDRNIGLRLAESFKARSGPGALSSNKTSGRSEPWQGVGKVMDQVE